MTDIQGVMERFATLPHSVTGQRPVEEGDWQSETTRFIQQYPALNLHQDYVDFLIKYGGAGIYFPETDWESPEYRFLTIYGFGDFEDPQETTIMDENGFFPFAFMQYQNQTLNPTGLCVASFAFDTTGTRPGGVYGPSSFSQGASYVLQYPSFLAWLEDVVRNEGQILLPSK